MSRKICVLAIISLLLFVSFSLSISVGSESNPELPDNYPTICVLPAEITAEVGETFTISVVVLDLTDNLYGFDIEFEWDAAIIEYISHVVTAPVESYEEGVLNSPILSAIDIVDPTAGTYLVAYASISPAEPFNGDGVFFTMTFEVLSSFNEQPFQIVSAMLSDDKGQPIIDYSHQNQGATFVTGDEVWEFIRQREKDPKAEGWLEWFRTQMRRHWGVG
ncbi:MAG: cohesin domain-containing protein [Candidatus Bathyarchaeota archaeon]|nr:cohesin domain-containing protein [Candidatus Bathyarchaeota archaeon]